MLERLWVYQRERFPLAPLALLALAVSAGATMYSALARGAPLPGGEALLAAAASALLVFAQMRILDEFKDFEDDARYRPYRPVPRGLVSRRELGAILAAASAAELVIAIAFDARLLWLLAALWGYLGLMTLEFFAREWLRARPFAYLATHVPLGGLIALYASAFEWLPRSQHPDRALVPFALAAVSCTALLEIGRKIRAPEDEEHGVVTYSAAWGRPAAIGAWLAAFALVLACGLAAAQATGHAALLAALFGCLALAGLAFALRRASDAIEPLSGIGALTLYAGLGPIAALLSP